MRRLAAAALEAIVSNAPANGSKPRALSRRDAPTVERPQPMQEIVVLREVSGDQHHVGRPPLPMHTIVRLSAMCAAIVILCLLIAVGVAASKPTIRGAQVDVLYQPSPNSTSSFQLDRDLGTQALILRSRTFLEPVAADAHLSTASLEKRSSVDLVPNTNVLRLTVTDRDGAKARLMANKIASAYVKRSFDKKTGTGPRILAHATVLPSPVSPKPLQAAAAGLLVGAALAAAAALGSLARLRRS